tara:strand:+ start:105 stop:971 length:867 start_codon:yes stop_codon:yes gene_type:complete
MILYIQTPAIPRSELHNKCIKTMMEELDNCNHFSEIHWFVNIDVIKDTKYEWEDYSETELNFKNIAKSLSKVKLNLNISHEPCFYLAFRHLTLSVLKDVEENKFQDDQYCTMWLEDDWNFIDIEMFKNLLTKFLQEEQYLVYTLHGLNGAPSSYPGKLNMGGNPDIIKGSIHKLFKDIDLDKSNKRDPENIRKFLIWYPYILEMSQKSPVEALWDGHGYAYNHLTRLLTQVNGDINHPIRKLQKKILASNTVEGIQGDTWRANIAVHKNWDSWDKLGMDSNKNFTYKS